MSSINHWQDTVLYLVRRSFWLVADPFFGGRLIKSVYTRGTGVSKSRFFMPLYVCQNLKSWLKNKLCVLTLTMLLA